MKTTREEILILTTGGTIDKVYFDAKSDYEVGNTIVGKILEEAHTTYPYRIVELMQKDSLNLDDVDRALILQTIQEQHNEKVLITHGSDTIIDTATYLESLTDKTIVLTGSLAPARFALTDAMFNIGMAMAAIQLLDHGVYIAMNGTVFSANNVVKNRSENRFELKF